MYNLQAVTGEFEICTRRGVETRRNSILSKMENNKLFDRK